MTKRRKPKQILFGGQARDLLLKGLTQTAKVLSVTYGPLGRNVMMERQWRGLLITRDGMMVARETQHANPPEEIANQIMKLVGTAVGQMVGDGTTTAMMLLEDLYRRLWKRVAAGENPIILQRALGQALTEAIAHLKTIGLGTPSSTDHLRLFISRVAHEEGIATLLAEAIDQAGKDGTVLVEEGTSASCQLTTTDGIWFDQGPVDSRFPLNEEGRIEFVRPMIFISDFLITENDQIVPLLEVAAQNKQPLLLICEDVQADARKTLLTNVAKGTVQAVAVHAPEWGERRIEFLRDIAAATAGRALLRGAGDDFKDLKVSDFGRANTVRVAPRKTEIIDGAGDSTALHVRLKQLRAHLANTDSAHDKDVIRRRISMILGGMTTIKVGGSTKTEIRERKARVEDALSASRALLKHGAVLAGGCTYLQLAEHLRKIEQPGHQLLADMLEQPLRWLLQSAGQEAQFQTIRESLQVAWSEGKQFVWNVLERQLSDVWETGLFEPRQELKAVLLYVVSAATTLLTAECVITER